MAPGQPILTELTLVLPLDTSFPRLSFSPGHRSGTLPKEPSILWHYLSYSYCCGEKIPWQNKLKGSRAWFDSQFKGPLHGGREIMVARAWGCSWSHGLFSKEAQRGECLDLVPFPLLYIPGHPTYAMIFSTFMVGHSNSTQPNIILHTHAQRPVSLVILDPIELIMANNVQILKSDVELNLLVSYL